MTKQIQRLVDFGLGRETARGTAEAAADFWIPKVDFDFIPQSDKAVDDSGLGVIDARSESKVVSKRGEGSFGGIAYDNQIGLLLALALGTWSTDLDTPIDDVMTHTFARLNTNEHPAATIFVKDENLDERYALAMLSQLTFNIEVGDYVRVTGGFLSKDGAATASTPDYVVGNPFMATHGAVKFASTIAGLNGATGLKSLRLTINKNPEGWQELGDVEYADIVNKEFSIEGELSKIYDGETERAWAQDGTEMACSIVLTNADVTIGTASNPTLSFELAPMAFTDFAITGGPGDIQVMSMRFDGNFKISDVKTISAILINTQTAY